MTTFVCYGYTCSCGERILVYRFPVNQPVSNPPMGVSVLCRNGHERRIRVEQIGQLDQWTESGRGTVN
jgi:hypothetical protein